MSLPYLLILVLYALASFGVVLVIAEASVSLFERELRKGIERLTPADGVVAHVILRLLPGIAAFIVTAFSALPGYLTGEPTQTQERPSLWLVALAIVGFYAIAVPLARVCRMALQTSAKTRVWMGNTVAKDTFSRIPVLELGVTNPVIVASGLLKATIFLSSAVRSLLSPRELRAVLRHEVAHCKQHHNLAKLLWVAAPRLLRAEAMEKSLRETIEYAADDEACGMPGDALNLASALVVLAKQSAVPSKEMLYTPIFDSNESAILERRVKRLVLPVQSNNHVKFLHLAGGCASILAAVALVGSLPAAQHAFRETLELLVR